MTSLFRLWQGPDTSFHMKQGSGQAWPVHLPISPTAGNLIAGVTILFGLRGSDPEAVMHASR